MKKFLYGVIVLLIFLPLYGAVQVGFNKVGYVTNIPNNSQAYYSVALQADGKIVAVGEADNNGFSDGLIARFNPNGSLDTTAFNTGSVNGGPGFINIQGTTNSFAYLSVAVQPDGKIVAVGATDNGDGLIARFTSLGELDTSFGNNGFITNTPNNSFIYYSVVVQPDGKIVAVGQTKNNDGLIARFNPNGSLDTTAFNTGSVNGDPGFINTEGLTDSSIYRSVALQPDGKIVAVGQTDNGDGLISRFTSLGTLDTSFGNNGFITNTPNNSFIYYSVVVQPDGKIVAVGQTKNNDGLIARFTSLGALDTTFNRTGFITNTPNNSFIYYSVAVQPDGKIVAVGRTDNNDGFSDGLIARFNPNGDLDTTFNNGTGFINTEGATNSSAYYSVAVQPDGKIVAVGWTDNNDGLIARFLSNGVLDAESNWNLQNFRESNNLNKVSIGLLG